MANEATAVVAPAPAAAPAAPAPAAAPAVAPAAAAPAAAAPAPAADATAIAAAESALATATAAAQGKAADSVEAKAATTAKAALDALKPAPAAAPAKKAPESYLDFTAPEGVALDKDVSAQVKAVAKDLDLSQADAQKLIDKIGPVLAKGETARITAFVTKRADGWRAATLADAEIGGEKAAENMAVAMKTFDAFGTPALRDVLNKTGLGDNPELLRWAFRIGKAIGPDNKFVAGTTLASAAASPEDRLWPDKK